MVAEFEELKKILVNGPDDEAPESDDYSEDSYP